MKKIIVILLAIFIAPQFANAQIDTTGPGSTNDYILIKGYFAELTADKSTLHGAEQFKLYLNCYTETAAPKLLPYKYPVDALNYLAAQGWRLISVFVDPDGIRHYELEKK